MIAKVKTEIHQSTKTIHRGLLAKLRCDRPDLNQRLPDLQSGTLPAELLSLVLRRLVISLQGFWLWWPCSSQPPPSSHDGNSDLGDRFPVPPYSPSRQSLCRIAGGVTHTKHPVAAYSPPLQSLLIGKRTSAITQGDCIVSICRLLHKKESAKAYGQKR